MQLFFEFGVDEYQKHHAARSLFLFFCFCVMNNGNCLLMVSAQNVLLLFLLFFFGDNWRCKRHSACNLITLSIYNHTCRNMLQASIRNRVVRIVYKKKKKQTVEKRCKEFHMNCKY